MNDFKDRMRQIERLVERVKGSPEAVELLQTVMEFHRTAVDRMMEIAADAGDAGWQIIESFSRDDLVANMLLLHGLHPMDLDARVHGALDKVRPLLHSHGGDVELIDIAEGSVRLRLIGSCHGCPSSTMTLKSSIEKAIYEAAPDVASIECC
jgi:Fe-S cluster biogenesis protein NfuA